MKNSNLLTDTETEIVTEALLSCVALFEFERKEIVVVVCELNEGE